MDLKRIADDQLPRLWGEVMEEMLDRKIVTSRNHPIASLGERVAAEHLNGTLAPPNTKGYDLRVGRRKIEVKAVRDTGNRSNLSPIRGEDFSAVVVVVFDPFLRVTEILELRRRYVAECWRHSKHVNGYILTLQKVRKHPKARHIDILSRWRQ